MKLRNTRHQKGTALIISFSLVIAGAVLSGYAVQKVSTETAIVANLADNADGDNQAITELYNLNVAKAARKAGVEFIIIQYPDSVDSVPEPGLLNQEDEIVNRDESLMGFWKIVSDPVIDETSSPRTITYIIEGSARASQDDDPVTTDTLRLTLNLDALENKRGATQEMLDALNYGLVSTLNVNGAVTYSGCTADRGNNGDGYGPTLINATTWTGPSDVRNTLTLPTGDSSTCSTIASSGSTLDLGGKLYDCTSAVSGNGANEAFTIERGIINGAIYAGSNIHMAGSDAIGSSQNPVLLIAEGDIKRTVKTSQSVTGILVAGGMITGHAQSSIDLQGSTLTWGNQLYSATELTYTCPTESQPGYAETLFDLAVPQEIVLSWGPVN